jgi:hypothetical protein
MSCTDNDWYAQFLSLTRRPRPRRRPILETPMRSLSLIPDFPIRIEKIGGGASPEGYAAILWPDEIPFQQLRCDFSQELVEDWTPED